MLIKELIEHLIYLKQKYEIYYPDDKDINLVCNILEEIPQDIEVKDLLINLEEKCINEK